VIFEQYVDTTHYQVLYAYPDNTIRFAVKNGSGLVTYFYTEALTLNANTWYHIAVVRNGNTPLIFLDGVSKSITEHTTLSGKTLPDYAGNMQIGRSQYPGYPYDLNAWLDEFRWSKGIARWTSNFTPPSEEY
jgi:hypothetical protein